MKGKNTNILGQAYMMQHNLENQKQKMELNIERNNVLPKSQGQDLVKLYKQQQLMELQKNNNNKEQYLQFQRQQQQISNKQMNKMKQCKPDGGFINSESQYQYLKQQQQKLQQYQQQNNSIYKLKNPTGGDYQAKQNYGLYSNQQSISSTHLFSEQTTRNSINANRLNWDQKQKQQQLLKQYQQQPFSLNQKIEHIPKQQLQQQQQKELNSEKAYFQKQFQQIQSQSQIEQQNEDILYMDEDEPDQTQIFFMEKIQKLRKQSKFILDQLNVLEQAQKEYMLEKKEKKRKFLLLQQQKQKQQQYQLENRQLLKRNSEQQDYGKINFQSEMFGTKFPQQQKKLLQNTKIMEKQKSKNFLKNNQQIQYNTDLQKNSKLQNFKINLKIESQQQEDSLINNKSLFDNPLFNNSKYELNSIGQISVKSGETQNSKSNTLPIVKSAILESPKSSTLPEIPKTQQKSNNQKKSLKNINIQLPKLVVNGMTHYFEKSLEKVEKQDILLHINHKFIQYTVEFFQNQQHKEKEERRDIFQAWEKDQCEKFLGYVSQINLTNNLEDLLPFLSNFDMYSVQDIQNIKDLGQKQRDLSYLEQKGLDMFYVIEKSIQYFVEDINSEVEIDRLIKDENCLEQFNSIVDQINLNNYIVRCLFFRFLKFNYIYKLFQTSEICNKMDFSRQCVEMEVGFMGNPYSFIIKKQH